MNTEINYCAAWHFKICNEDCIILATDVNKDHGDNAPSIIHDNNDVGKLDIICIEDSHMNIVLIYGLDVLLHSDDFNIIGQNNEILDLLSCTSNADDSNNEGSSPVISSGDKTSNDDDIGDEHIAAGKDHFDSKGYKPPKWSPFTNKYGKAL